MKMQMYNTEVELIDALKQGEKRACADLVERFSSQVYRVALRLMDDPSDAEDVLQETFISACDHAEDFEGRSSLSTWLYRIANNAGLMRLRKRRVPTVSIDEPVELDDDYVPRHLADWSLDPDRLVLTNELRQVMDTGVAQLSEALRTVFVMRDLEGLSTAETAELLGISESAVKVRLHRARLQLRDHLAEYLAGGDSGHRTGE
jgi:RNA polymerase sigma-70 factor (ECF subfamily)